MELAQGCVSCTLREDMLPLLRKLARTPGVERIALHLDPALEPEGICWALHHVVVDNETQPGAGHAGGEPVEHGVGTRAGPGVRRGPGHHEGVGELDLPQRHSRGHKAECGVSVAGPWLAALAPDDWEKADPDRRALASLRWDPYYGDRDQEIVVIAHQADPAAITAALREALLTDAELAEGEAAWRGYPDPFGQWHTDPREETEDTEVPLSNRKEEQ